MQKLSLALWRSLKSMEFLLLTPDPRPISNLPMIEASFILSISISSSIYIETLYFSARKGNRVVKNGPWKNK